MRVMVFVKATPNSEAGTMPSEELFRDMTAFKQDAYQWLQLSEYTFDSYQIRHRSKG